MSLLPRQARGRGDCVDNMLKLCLVFCVVGWSEHTQELAEELEMRWLM